MAVRASRRATRERRGADRVRGSRRCRRRAAAAGHGAGGVTVLVAGRAGRGTHRAAAFTWPPTTSATPASPPISRTPAASPVAAVLRRRSPAYTAEDMTDDAVAVLDAIGWDSAHLFGHSMGGQLAQRIALRHPARVRSLTSSASLPSDAGGLAAARYVRWARWPGWPG